MSKPMIQRSFIQRALLLIGLLLFVVPAEAQQPSGAAPSNPSVAIQSFTFQPPTLTIQIGQTVTWTNNDEAAHTVTSSTGAFGSGTLSQNGTFQQLFSSPGTFSYFCAFHGSMQGTITVEGPMHRVYLPLIIGSTSGLH